MINQQIYCYFALINKGMVDCADAQAKNPRHDLPELREQD